MSANTIHLKDYQLPNYLIEHTHLHFVLTQEFTRVKSRLLFKANPGVASSVLQELKLDGVELKLIALSIDGNELQESSYQVSQEGMSISLEKHFSSLGVAIPEQFELGCETEIYPQSNTSLEGLYRSRTMYCTQCEAEGFRKITYYPDRPDVMSIFTTVIEAPAEQHPVLLSNGNKVSDETSVGGMRRVSWHDPFKKPAYLFALVAGDLELIEDSFTTCSGREVSLQIFVEAKDLDKCDHAMRALKNSMHWDEQVYGREYDLELFMIVAVDDFNMGAMENKGLNIFNTSCVLAKAETTTDAGFQRVEGVVAHEYFHNWSGNRVTCRDWFQLSLKEGFTVFRDSQFSADMGSATVKRVEDVNLLRNAQFVEDGGPMAHAVRPASFIEISNFYTLTIYEKGAEIVRMIHTLIGAELFRQGSDLYFQRHDGEAVTVEHFVAAMADASGRDFSQFMNWYSQAGTPELEFSESYDEEAEEYQLKVSQSCRQTAETENKQAYLIPIEMSLLGEAGALPLQLKDQVINNNSADNTRICLELNQAQQLFTFSGVKEKPVASVMRGLSAPVKIKFPRQQSSLRKIMLLDSDGFCRWDASQVYAFELIQKASDCYREKGAQGLNPSLKAEVEEFARAYQQLLQDPSLDPAMVALMLELPSVSYVIEQNQEADVDAIYYSREAIKELMAEVLEAELAAIYQAYNHSQPYQANADQIAQRSLKNTALSYLMLLHKPVYQQACLQQFEQANNMTDTLAALRCIMADSSIQAQAQQCLQSFYTRWSDEALVVNQWFMIQSVRQHPEALAEVQKLLQHPAYDVNNPNKVRSVVAAFCAHNSLGFHRADGKAYQFLAEQIISLDKINPQLAARLLSPLSRWQRFDSRRQGQMKAALKTIAAQTSLSKDVFEQVNKSL